MNEQVVYLDVLLGLNLLVNYFLLLFTAKCASMPYKRLRLLLGSAVGAITSLIIFAPRLNLFIDLLLKVLFASGITAASFGIKNFKNFIRCCCIFIISTLLYGGVAIGLYFLLSPEGMIINNSVVYINISALWLMIYTIAAYLILSVIQFVAKRRAPQALNYRVTIGFCGKKVTVNAVVDTGNSLCETFSQAPVAVCSLNELKHILPEQITEMVIRKDITAGFQALSQSQHAVAIRLIPYNDVSGEGVLPAFRPESFELEQNGKRYSVRDVYVAVSEKQVTGTDYSCILNPKIIEISNEKRRAEAYEG
ncbi:sigma-E processing peptidase SpoIIGA [Acetanaerobacterium elongatum]|uniref:Sporulation sigma-E factor-processing peptidase n=1 Tax=Acetanaerobacterium elongatum TaxID=258515 RepID=A0A1G9WXD5_9FIRM|nr:sigma-E processing peptidase SpoIIGA [Acetanaerobacterium elongatum]SDM88745.1 stage II sporulation protein GA (sporulation sigma-E factor processing peptidase) [Acetanaerobacterium elongatum]